jgi:hypothetical protein
MVKFRLSRWIHQDLDSTRQLQALVIIMAT